MKAIRFHKVGGPEVLQFDEIKIKKPIGEEALFKIEAFALNQADILFFNGMHYTQPNFTLGIGSEATGEVVEVGEKVTKFKKGDFVFIPATSGTAGQGALRITNKS